MHRFTPLLLIASTAQAYITSNGDRTRWPVAPQPALSGCSADLPVDACRAAVAAAFTTWGAIDGVDLAFMPLVDGIGDVTVDFVAGRPDLVGVLGVTTTTTEGAAIVSARVELNDDFTWAVRGPRGTFDVQATTTHEVGHALGLAHSPDRAATMYWHYDAGGAALGEDDRRGMRFLYGARAGNGQPCDQCELPSDCADGICLQRLAEDGVAYCARPCEGGCAAGEICVALADGGDACIPANGSCGVRGDQPAGASCWGPFQCAGGLRCVVFPADARCAAPCEGPGDCDAATVCALDPVDLPRACLRPGDQVLGAACAWATDCASGVCLPDGRCSAWCNGPCPAGWRCVQHPHWPDQPTVCTPDRVPPDAGPPDAGPSDAGPPDADSPDVGLDADASDIGAPVDSAVDARPPDGAAFDGGPRDAAPPALDVIRASDAPGDGCTQGTDQSIEALILLIIMTVCLLIVQRARRG